MGLTLACCLPDASTYCRLTQPMLSIGDTEFTARCHNPRSAKASYARPSATGFDQQTHLPAFVRSLSCCLQLVLLLYCSYSPDAALLQRERLLWERQEALWQQQLSHWQHERNIWAQREATLLEHIQQLHSQMTTLLSQHTNSPNQTDRATLSATNPSNKQAEQRVVASFAASDPTTLDAQPSPPSLTPSQSAGSESAATQQPAAQNDAPTGPPPTLCTDSDDIYWVNQLQTSLANKGYYCGEEESEDFVFGTNTESAVMTFQVPMCLYLKTSLLTVMTTFRGSHKTALSYVSLLDV